MALLNELSLFTNPRFGVDWTIELILRRLLGFWKASYCLILLAHETDLDLYLVSSDDPQRCQKVPVRSQSEVPFIDMADASSLVFNGQARPMGTDEIIPELRPSDANYRCPPPPSPGEASSRVSERTFICERTASLPERFRGRIVVSSGRPRAFDISDAAFLQQVASQALPVD